MATAIDRRSFLARSAVTAGGVAAAGSVAELAMADTAGAANYGGTLKVGLESADQAGYGPAFGKMDASGFVVMRAIFDPIMQVDTNGNPQPYLASSVVPNKTYTEWTITLRSGIKFHDGTALTGAVLAANINQWLNTGAVAHYAVSALLKGVVSTSGQSVTVATKVPWVTFPHSLAEQQIAYVQSLANVNANIANPGGHPGDLNPVGTGPFKFVSYDGTSTGVITVTKNQNYWRSGLPYLDTIEFHPNPSGTSRFQALSGGALHLAHFSEISAIQSVRSGNFSYIDDSGKSGYAVRLPAVDCIQLNCREGFGGYKGPFYGSGPATPARKALAAALNRSLINSTVNQGVTTLANSVYPVGSAYPQPSTTLPAYSASAAKTYAKAAKLTKFTLNAVQDSPVQTQWAGLIQTYCGQAGITVTINYMTQTDLINHCLTGTYDACLWNQFGGCSPDLNFPWWSTLDGSNGALTSINMAGNFDTKIEAAMLAGMAAGKTAASAKQWGTVATLLNTDIPYVWSNYQVSCIASATNVKGWQSPTLPGGGNAMAQEGLVFTLTTAYFS